MKKLLLSLLLLPMFCHAQLGYINTIAGNGSSGFSGDGGAATAAQMQAAEGTVSCDGSGNVYIDDYHNGRLRKVSPAGIITTVAGGGSSTADGVPATSASIALGAFVSDISGNIYLGDGSRVRKIAAGTGIITTVAGTGSAGYSGDGGPATAAQLGTPYGMCLDFSGNLYIADESNACIRKVNTSGIITTYAGTGSAGFSGDGGAATAAQLQSPDGMCFDALGNLYVADRYNYRIRKIDASGIITTYAGNGSYGFSGDGGAATAASFAEPSDVRIDSYGNLYIADPHNSRVRKIDPTGITSTFAGGGSSASEGIPATSASLSETWGIGIDGNNNIYITDRYNYRVRRVNGLGFPVATADSFSVYINTLCTGPSITVLPAHYSAGLQIKTWFGDGAMQTDTFSAYSGISLFAHVYGSSGTYSIKHVLYNGSLAIDSITYSYNYTLCNSFQVRFYYDGNSNCVKDSTDFSVTQSSLVEVDSNSIPVDIISVSSGLYYKAYGVPGDIYAFKVIAPPGALHVTCPSSGIIYDTISATAYADSAQSIGMECTTATGYDLGIVSSGVATGVHAHAGDIYAFNNSCPPINSTVTLHFSPKHAYYFASPTPASTTATSITWNISALSAADAALTHLYYHLEVSGSTLTPGDTVHSYIVITPDSGDADTSNNVIDIIDTVRSGWDPNEISVKPAGCIASGTTPNLLTYAINFENTGNDTAHNIYVMDTLSDYVDFSSMRLVMSSHEMYISKLKDAVGHNILKFDFPAINLLDSSHHGKCDGAVIFNINTKPGLATGTNVNNRAGIYFDVNAVVMTNQVTNGIGCPVVNEVKPVSSINTIEFYPNPANNVLHIKLAVEKYQSFAITNSLGTSLLTGTLTGNNTQLNIQTLPAGLYFINLKGDGGNEVRRFVKR